MTMIRSGMMISMMAATLLTAACATEESTVPESRPSRTKAPTNISDPPRDSQPPRDKQPPSVKSTPDVGETPGMSRSSNDPTQDCLSRIPKDATAGQRSVAEQSCQRDTAERRTDTKASALDPGDDSPQSCMNRIPRDASPGQRMVAEGSCKQANQR